MGNHPALVVGHGPVPPDDIHFTGGCVMDFAVWRLSRHTIWADAHPCFNEVVTYLAQAANDRCDDKARKRLSRDFPGRIDRCRATKNLGVENRINTRLATWVAEELDSTSPPHPNEIYDMVYSASMTDEERLDLLDRLLDQWEKIAADEGVLTDLWTWEDYNQASGS